MKTYIVDAFTNTAFKGNPAGVCILKTHVAENTMQAIAAELNLSETAFIQQIAENKYTIRYFSPKMEIPLCGHATLAASKIIFETTPFNEIHFNTFYNVPLIVKKEQTKICMEFPSYNTVPATVTKKMLEALGIDEVLNAAFNTENKILVLEIAHANTLINLKPNFQALEKSHPFLLGVTVTAPSTNKEYDFYSRFFWPWSGSNEDPVTGVAHTVLANYWSKKLQKTSLKAFQASQRTGVLVLELLSNNKLLIKGEAVKVFEGNLILE